MLERETRLDPIIEIEAMEDALYQHAQNAMVVTMHAKHVPVNK
jgi:hypothetical protein